MAVYGHEYHEDDTDSSLTTSDASLFTCLALLRLQITKHKFAAAGKQGPFGAAVVEQLLFAVSHQKRFF